VALSNSDPEVLGLFLRFLRHYFGVADKKIRLTCHLFADHLQRQHEVERFWLDRLGLPTPCLTKSFVNKYSRRSLRKRVNKLPYGTCRIVVNNTAIVQSIYGSIQEYGGFERPEWLD
jgi:hypothetical protein